MTDERTAASVRWDLSAYYFFTFGGMGALLPFLPLLLAGRGLSATEVAWVMLLGPAANLVAPPLWGWLADTFSVRLGLMRAAGVGCAAAALGFIEVSTFGLSLLVMGLFSLFRAPIIPLADAAAHASLGPRAHDFARIRLWGSLGFALLAYGVGKLDGSNNPTAMLGLTAAAYALSSLSTARLRAPARVHQPLVLGRTLEFMRQPRLLALLLGSALYYVAHGSYDVYFGLHMRALGHDDAFVGLSWMVAVFAEIALMVYAPRMLARRSGEGLLVLCAVASLVRWTLLSVAESQLAILSAQVLHALTFGLWYLSLVRYIQLRAPEAVRTAVQSVLQAGNGLGMMVGYLVSGQLFEAAGGAAVFQLAAAAAVAAGLSYGVLWRRSLAPAT